MRKFSFLLLLLSAFALFQPMEVQAQNERKVLIRTDFGDMVFKLYNDTPLHRDNFIKKVKEGFYNGTLFHRSVPYFMIQGGDPNSKNAGFDKALGVDTCPTIPAEILPHHFHKKGALAAARLPDQSNPEKRSSGCQFFVVQGYKHSDEQITANENTNRKFGYFERAWYKVRGGMPFLDGDYTVFGEIVEGLEVLDMILAVPTNAAERPLVNVVMKEVKMLN